MQVTESSADGLKREFKVTLAAGEIGQKVDARLRELGRQVRVPGFRPGKVPVTILKQRFGDSVLGEVLDRAVADSSEQALMERGLRPAMQPKIEITSFEKDKDLEYTLAVEVLPEIEPMNFAELELERLEPEIDGAEVEEALRRMAAQYKRSEPVTSARKSKSGDILVIDFKGFVGGAPFPGGEGQDHHLELGSGSFIEGFEDQLIGHAAGARTEVKLTFPEAYVNEELAGKPATFEVTVKEIREPAPFEVDEELAKMSGHDSLEALRAAVQRQLEQEYHTIARARLKRHLLDSLAERHDFSVPEGMVDLEFEQIWKQVEESREKGELDPADQGKSEEELREEYRQIGERRVRLGLLMSETGERNNITLSNEEIERAILEEARRHPGQEREFLGMVRDNPQALASIRAPLFESKVIDFILELAKLTTRRLPAAEMLKLVMDEEQADKAESAPKKKTKTRKGDGAKAKTGKTGVKAAKKPAKAAKEPAAKTRKVAPKAKAKAKSKSTGKA